MSQRGRGSLHKNLQVISSVQDDNSLNETSTTTVCGRLAAAMLHELRGGSRSGNRSLVKTHHGMSSVSHVRGTRKMCYCVCKVSRFTLQQQHSSGGSEHLQVSDQTTQLQTPVFI